MSLEINKTNAKIVQKYYTSANDAQIKIHV